MAKSICLRIIIVLLSVLNTLFVYAKREPTYTEHALIVHRLSCWAPDYLTITNNWDNACLISAPSSLKTLSVITEINGESTKDMEPEDFYSIIDCSDSFSVAYMTKIRGENKSFTATLSKKKGRLMIYAEENTMKYDWFYSDKEKRDIRSYDQYTGSPYYNYGPTPNDCTSTMFDQNVDFFEYCTFDYMLESSDYAIDLGLVQHFAKELEKKGFKYDPDKPDIHLYLTKNATSNIENVYIPNITSETQSSGYTTGRFHIYYGNYNTLVNGRSHSSSTSTTHTTDNGTMKALVDGDVYTQFTILDAKRMDSSNPPVIWQLVHNRHFTKEFNAIENIKKLREALTYFPFPMPEFASLKGICTPGLFFNKKLGKGEVVTDVLKNGWADSQDIKPGFILKDYKKSDHWVFTTYKELKFDKIKIKIGGGIAHEGWDFAQTELNYFLLPEILINEYQ